MEILRLDVAVQIVFRRVIGYRGHGRRNQRSAAVREGAGRKTRSGMSGDSVGAGRLSSEAVGDVIDMEFSIPESTLDEDVSNSIEFSDLGWRTSAGTESFRLRDGNVVGVEAEGDMSLDLGSDSCGGEDLEWYSCCLLYTSDAADE